MNLTLCGTIHETEIIKWINRVIRILYPWQYQGRHISSLDSVSHQPLNHSLINLTLNINRTEVVGVRNGKWDRENFYRDTPGTRRYTFLSKRESTNNLTYDVLKNEPNYTCHGPLESVVGRNKLHTVSTEDTKFKVPELCVNHIIYTNLSPERSVTTKNKIIIIIN